MSKQSSTNGQRHRPKTEALRKRRLQRRRHPEPEQEATLAPAPFIATSHEPAQSSWLYHPHSSPLQRQTIALTMGQTNGNRQLTAQLQAVAAAKAAEPADTVQTKGHAQAAAHPGGRGPGRIAGADEQPYEVTGKHLTDLLPQLAKFDDFAAVTETRFAHTYQTRQLRNGSWRATVQWSISGATTQLPQWVDYDQACPAAQQEWDRYLRRLRQHEQAKHIEAVRTFLTSLKSEYRVVTAATEAEVAQIIEGKKTALETTIQTEVHDSCGHGAEIDAILHADRDTCQ